MGETRVEWEGRQVEPALMERHHMLPEDEALRSTDVPERLQLARGRDLRHFDPAAAAECALPHAKSTHDLPPRPSEVIKVEW